MAVCETRLSALLSGGHVHPGFRAADVDDAVDRLLTPLLKAERLADDAIATALAAVRAREAAGSTLAGPVAIPHARIGSLGRIVAALGLNREGVYDGEPEPQIVLVFASPAAAPAEHLRFLAGVAQIFRRDDVVDELLAASTPDHAVEAIRSRER